jgi:hypothetical protein
MDQIQTKATYSVADFCTAHGITRPTFYDLLKKGHGPRIMKVGSRTLISIEAAADWRRQMEEGAQILPSRRNGRKSA